MDTETRGPKQVVVMNKALKMRRGKEMAQAGHAFMKDLLDCYKYHLAFPDRPSPLIEDPERNQYYLTGIFRKIVLYAESYEQMMEVYDDAGRAGLTVHLITDSGFTEFNQVPTHTCICIGPHFDEKIDPITRPRNLTLA